MQSTFMDSPIGNGRILQFDCKLCYTDSNLRKISCLAKLHSLDSNCKCKSMKNVAIKGNIAADGT